MRKILLPILFLISISAFSANYSGQIQQFKQPDGAMVDVKLFGSEYYMRAEGLDSYTLIRDEESKWICYAKLSNDQTKLESTGIVYRGVQNDPASLRSDLNLPKHLQISLEARHKLIRDNQQLLDGNSSNSRLTPNSQGASMATPIHPVNGNIIGLTIVVDFSDEPGTLPMSEFDSFLNDSMYNNFGMNGSLRDFFRDASGGLVEYQNVVFGYYRAPQTFAYYDAQPFAQGAKQILGQALNWIEAQGFDFSTLTTNPDNSIMAINLMHTGNPPTWSQGMWFHKGNYTTFSADGVHSITYNTSPANAPLKLNTIAHENGHMVCKWPDTYKYDQSEDGIGAFDLMCASGPNHNPVLPNPLFRSNAGWGEVIDMTGYVGMNYDTANSMIAYRHTNVNDTNEFFLFEHRQMWGRSTGIPDEGLTIWHIDRNGDNQSTHHEVYLMHANNDIGNHFAACYNNPYGTEFSEYTSPSSNWYDGTQSGLLIWGIDTPNVDVLPYHIGPGATTTQFSLTYSGLSNDNNNNGYPEPGETADLAVNLVNTGQLSSPSAVLTCTPIGPNAGYLTVNTPVMNMGIINLQLPYYPLVGVTFDPQTPMGTIIDVEFTIADAQDTATVTANLIVGRVINMNNLSQSLCTAVFFDWGTLNNYNNNSNYTKTILPSVPGNYVRADFLSFEIEFDATCSKDFLSVYNGPNTSSPLIGTYCGTTIPATIQSSDPSGALTFQFHSDSVNNQSGWEAVISCSPTPGIDEYSERLIQLFPNPTTGRIYLNKTTAKVVSVSDAMGKNADFTISPSGESQVIDLSGNAKGIYFIKFQSGNKFYHYRVVKN